MGESTTYCTGIEDDGSTYPARLEIHLRARRPDLDIEVINAGVGGYTSIENLLRYHFHIAPLSPDLIVYYYTHNDIHARRMPYLSRDYREYSRSWHEPPFGGGIRGWIARRRALATGDIGNIVRRYDELAPGSRRAANTAKNPPDYFRANITALILLIRAAGVCLMFVNPPYRNLQQDGGMDPVYTALLQHRGIIEELGAVFGFPVYDLASEMPYPSDPRGFPSEYYLDPTHVNERGADLMAELIAKAIAANVLN
jgi:lysophospholipase L1-like esterase